MTTSSRRLSGAGLPLRLFDLPDPPAALFVRGELPSGPIVAIVGTRSPTSEARAYARQLAQCLAAHGVVIASGGALGIDTSAHQGALDVGGKTLVVAPSSFDRPYPSQNAALFARVVAEGGAFLSAFEAETPAKTPQFFVRNSYLVALCHALVMVEAPLRSGARNAALWARRLGRPLFVVPATPWNSRGLGCIVELKLGARPLYSYRDLLESLREQNLHCIPLLRGPIATPPLLAVTVQSENRQLPGSDVRSVVSAEGSVPLKPDTRKEVVARSIQTPSSIPSVANALDSFELKVFEAIELGARHPDEICAMSGLSARQVQALLLTLRLRKVIATDPAGTYRLPYSDS